MLTEPARTVPAVLTPIVGRDDELHLVLATLDREDVRLVTVTGLGGVGKTRLAVAVAEAARSRYRDGVTFVELAAIGDAGRVIAAIAAAAGIRELGADPVAENLRAFLRPRQMLLVLDNFEHVLDATPAVLQLLADCPGITILITSRMALRVTSEREISLEPLRLPEDGTEAGIETLAANPAIALFAERAENVTPRFTLTADNVQVVAEICRRLDGIPLAIELAAPWVRMLSTGALLARLDDRLSLLARGTRDAPDRQQTLRATLEWSGRLLGEAEQAVFRRCAVFVGSWSLSAAEAVCTGWEDDPEPIDILQAMGALVDHSLVYAIRSDAEDARFGMLETVREYALDRLAAADERAAVGVKLTEWSVAFAEAAQPGLFGPDQARWLDILEEERIAVRVGAAGALARGDARAAIRMVNALGRFWLVRGHQMGDHEWLLRAVEEEAGEDRRAREQHAFALLILGNSWFERGELPRAIETFARCAAAARELGSDSVQAAGLLNLGIVSAQIGEIARARAAAEEALALNRGLNLRGNTGKDLIILGGILDTQGDLDGAEALLDEALAINLELGDTRVVALNLNTMGAVARSRGDAAGAARLFEQSRSLSQEIGEKRGTASALVNLGWLALDRGDIRVARDRFFAAMRLRKEIGDRWNLADCAEGFAVAIVAEHPAAALDLLAGASVIKAAIGGSPARAETAKAEQTARLLLGRVAAEATWAAGAAQPTSDGLLAAAAAIAAPGAPVIAVPMQHQSAAPSPRPAPALAATREAGPERVAALSVGANQPPRPKLSRREREVLAMIVTGHQDREIADALFVTSRTVSWHVTNIFNKLGVNSRVAAAVLAIREGLVDPAVANA